MLPAIHVQVSPGVALLNCRGLNVQFYKKITNYFLIDCINLSSYQKHIGDALDPRTLQQAEAS